VAHRLRNRTAAEETNRVDMTIQGIRPIAAGLTQPGMSAS